MSYTDECGEQWNHWHLPPPEPFTLPTPLNAAVKRKTLVLREKIYKIQQTLQNLRCLDFEAAVLSRFLFKNYRAVKKDKGFQLLKMVMTSLNKYLRMNINGNLDLLRRNLPFSFSPLAETDVLPSKVAITWILARIQAFAALFYKVYHLTKRAGKFLYQRLRLLWNPGVLVLCLGMAARIHVIARHLVQQAANWHSDLVPFIRHYGQVDVDPFKGCTRNLKEWLGGLYDLTTTKKGSTDTLDMVFQLIDLTDDQDDENDNFIQIIKDYGCNVEENDEIKCVFEQVVLDSPQTDDNVQLLESEPEFVEDEDFGENVTETDNESVVILPRVEDEDIGELVTEIDNESVVVLSKSMTKKRKRLSSLEQNQKKNAKQNKNKSQQSEKALFDNNNKRMEIRKKKAALKKMKKLRAIRGDSSLAPSPSIKSLKKSKAMKKKK